MKVTTCPSCGKKTLRRVTAPFTFTVRRKRVTVAQVPRLRCSSCGDAFFDQESNRVLDAQRSRRSRGAA